MIELLKMATDTLDVLAAVSKTVLPILSALEIGFRIWRTKNRNNRENDQNG